MGAIGLSIICDKCHAKHPINTGRFRHFYVFDDGTELSIASVLGYCDDCDGYKHIEVLQFDMKEVVHELGILHSCLTSIKEVKGLLSGKFVIDEYRPPKPLEITHIEWIADGVKRIMQRYRLQQERTSPPRCLTCGSHKVFGVESRTISQDPFEKSVLIHPGCGGSMHFEKEGHIMYKYLAPIRRYSVDGVFIEEFDPKEEMIY